VYKQLTLIALTIMMLLGSGCASIKQAGKSSSSLAGFLGFSELPDWYVTNSYDYVDSNWLMNDFGTNIHYRDIGEGPVVLMIHGEMDSMHSWEPWIEELSSNFRIIALDLPGAGLTWETHCVYYKTDTCAVNLSHEYLSHALTYFLEDLHLSSVNIVASSYGAYLAVDYAFTNPHRVEELVLL